MWRVIIVSAFFLSFIYYATLVLHLAGVVRIGRKAGFKMRYLIPFYLWIE